MMFVIAAFLVLLLDIVVRRSRNDREQVIFRTFFARCAAFMGGDISHIAAATTVE